jgi:hypothetical protein
MSFDYTARPKAPPQPLTFCHEQNTEAEQHLRYERHVERARASFFWGSRREPFFAKDCLVSRQPASQSQPVARQPACRYESSAIARCREGKGPLDTPCGHLPPLAYTPNPWLKMDYRNCLPSGCYRDARILQHYADVWHHFTTHS